VLGLMPAENLAAELIERADGCVLAPNERALDPAAAWVRDVVADPERIALLGKRSRALAEEEFALAGCTDRFEELLSAHARRR
jgi:glycosyltransferase involved in cell wall biosynthesis